MRINNNISAVVTNKQLLGVENDLSKSMERLSSGLSINHASDNPSGISMAGKMNAQIKGLNRAADNSQDGLSVMQTADGALGEVHSILQRMRELAVQAANDTNSLEEKSAAQQEVDQLKSELDRIAGQTQFNSKSLLDGSMDARVYGNNVDRIQVSEGVAAEKYEFTVTASATQAISATGSTIGGSAIFGVSGQVKINDYIIEIDDSMTEDQVYEELRKGAELGEASISNPGSALQFRSTAYGSGATVKIEIASPELQAKLGFPETSEVFGTNANVSLGTEFAAEHPTATVDYDGNKITITDKDDFKMSMMLEEGYTGDVNLEVTNVGIMKFHVGANYGQNISIRIGAVDTKSLYIDDIDLRTSHGASRAMDKLDEAISRVSEIRGKIGAYENRLETTKTSLDSTEENMQSAISRIQDVDMAEEMVEYTKDNVLVQAATSALAQANELPQMALQLLQ